MAKNNEIVGDIVRISSTYSTQIQGQLFLNNINVNQVVENPPPPPSPLLVVQGPTISTNTATTIATEPISITSIEYTLSLKQGPNVRTSKIFTQSDGTSVSCNEFGVSTLGSFTAPLPEITTVPNLQQQSFELRLEISDAATRPVQVRFSRVYI
jgi:hypothetical protein